MKHSRPAAVLMLLALASPSLAWNNTGHMLVAMRAWDAMTPSQRAWATDLLRQHPRYKEDLLDKAPPTLTGEDRDRWLFAWAATWPDQIYPLRFKEPKLFATAFHAGWHIIGLQIPIDSFDSAPPFPPTSRPATTQDYNRLNARDGLAFEIEQLSDPSLSAGDRAMVLCWVMHIVGDIHQPCHAASLVSPRFPAPDGDHVATKLKVQKPDGKTTGLHQIWDGALGGAEDLPTLDALDQAMAKEPALQPTALAELTKHRTISDWIAESYANAQHDVYTPEIRQAIAAQDADPQSAFKPITLSDTYRATLRPIAERRIVLGGLRLAELLSKASGKHN